MAHEEILAAVDAGRLMDCVRAVCTGERLSNEPEAQAFDVLHKSLEDAGCRVTRESLDTSVRPKAPPSRRAARRTRCSHIR